jgi:ADP-ribose pyrophosphatase YjhB (NUDIX family)
VRDDHVLLVRSSNPRYRPPLWWLPGGGIDFGETPLQAIAREFVEETGYVIGLPELIDVNADVRNRPNGDLVHTVRIIYRVHVTGGELRHEAEGTTAEVRWIHRDELNDLNVAPYALDALRLAGYSGK